MQSITTRPRAQLLHLNQASRSDFETSGDETIRLAREQIAKMREDYAKERREKLHVALATSRLSPEARRYLNRAIMSQQAFEKSALIPNNTSNELVDLVKRVDAK